jgi:uncharacterized protein (TIGR03000 family)
MNQQLLKLCLAAFGFLVLPWGSAGAQTYDTFEVLRLPDRTIYIFPKGYVPAVGAGYASVVNPWFAQPGFVPPAFSTSNVILRDGFVPASASYYGATDLAASPPTTSSVTLRLPENAEVWIQGKKMEEKGTERRFNLPTQDPRSTYDYEVRVEWPENDGRFSKTTHLNVRAGDQQSLTYVAALANQKPAAVYEPPMPREAEPPIK